MWQASIDSLTVPTLAAAQHALACLLQRQPLPCQGEGAGTTQQADGGMAAACVTWHAAVCRQAHRQLASAVADASGEGDATAQAASATAVDQASHLRPEPQEHLHMLRRMQQQAGWALSEAAAAALMAGRRGIHPAIGQQQGGAGKTAGGHGDGTAAKQLAEALLLLVHSLAEELQVHIVAL